MTIASFYRVLGAGLLLTAAALSFAGDAADPAKAKWELQYSFDQNDGYVTITDLKFSSPQRGIASGFIEKKMRNLVFGDYIKEQPLVFVTADGGQSWTPVNVKDRPLSLFLLDDSLGWLVTSQGLWATNEGGRSWRRVSAIKNLLQVYFLSPTHGFAAGSDDQALETTDGGGTWKPVFPEASANPFRKIGAEMTIIAFANSQEGFIGGSVPVPPGLDYSGRRRGNSFLTTKDGGKSWHQATVPMAGQATGASFSSEGHGLVLVQYSNAYSWPSEIFFAKLGDDSQNHLVFRDHHRVITDLLATSHGDAFAAGYENPGKSHLSPIPGKVHILQSHDLENWTEMPVDYRAVANRVILASSGKGDFWAATDTGSVLRLRNNYAR